MRESRPPDQAHCAVRNLMALPRSGTKCVACSDRETAARMDCVPRLSSRGNKKVGKLIIFILSRVPVVTRNLMLRRTECAGVHNWRGPQMTTCCDVKPVPASKFEQATHSVLHDIALNR
jgi:hypothetical protein